MDQINNEDKKLYVFSLPPKNTLTKKILFSLVILFSLIVSTEAVIYYLQTRTLQSSPSSSQTNITVSNTNPKTISTSNQIIKWIDSKKTANGQYYLQTDCDSQKQSCQNSPTDSRIGIMALWSHFLHYQINKDPNDITQINSIIENYNSPDSVGIQTNFWSCKVLWEVYESNILNDSQKEKTKKLCLESTFYRPYASDILKTNPKITDLNFLNFSHEYPDLYYQNYDPDSSYEDNKLINYSAFASDFVYRYYFTQDKQNLDDAEVYFKTAVTQLRQIPKNTYINGRCILGLATLDIYKVNQNIDYLTFAKNFTQNQGIDNYAKFINSPDSNIPGYFQNSVFEKASCSLFYQNLFNQTTNSEYKDYSLNLSKNILDKSLDQTAFYSVYSSDYFYSLKENSLVLEDLFNNSK